MLLVSCILLHADLCTMIFATYLRNQVVNGSACRRHILQCPSSLLSKNFEKLIQCDQRLHDLSHQPDVILETPGFVPKRSIFEDPNESMDCLDLNGSKYEQEATLPMVADPASRCALSSLSKNVGQQRNTGNHSSHMV